MVDRYQPDEEVLLLMNLGFHGFVEHSRVAKVLVGAVRAVAGGRLWFSEELLQQYVHTNAAVRRSSRGDRLYLTPRETEVLELLRRRRSNLEIAVKLGIAENTVKYHVNHILAKFRVNDRRELETSSLTSVGQIWDQLSKWLFAFQCADLPENHPDSVTEQETESKNYPSMHGQYWTIPPEVSASGHWLLLGTLTRPNHVHVESLGKMRKDRT
jgi:DNA-binding CsgD family transcriptional regulator